MADAATGRPRRRHDPGLDHALHAEQARHHRPPYEPRRGWPRTTVVAVMLLVVAALVLVLLMLAY